jgi:hypothetical protein
MPLCLGRLVYVIGLVIAVPCLGQPVFHAPASVDFGAVPVGRPAGAGLLVCFLGCPVAITNSGNAVLTITDGLVTGNASADFGITNGSLGPGSPFPVSISPGQTGFVQIIFSPSIPGPRTATISLQDNATGSPHEIVFTGTGIGNGDLGVSQDANNSRSATVVDGKDAIYDLAVSAGRGFSGTVNVTCNGLPRGASCASIPASFSIAGPQEEAVTFIVSTTPPALGTSQRRDVLPWTLAAMLSIMVAGVCCQSRRRMLWAAASVIVLCAIFGCSSSSSSSAPPDNSTPKGTFTLNAVATSGNLTRSQQLTLIVQ